MTAAGPFADIDPDRVADIARRIGDLIADSECSAIEMFATIACVMSVHLAGCSPRDRVHAANLLAEAILAGDGQIPEAGHA